MSVDPADVRRISHLARLRVSDGELERLTNELNRILDYVDQLGSIDDVEPPVDEVQPAESLWARGPELRADGLSDTPGAFAPDWRDSYFVVPPPPGVRPGEDVG